LRLLIEHIIGNGRSGINGEQSAVSDQRSGVSGEKSELFNPQSVIHPEDARGALLRLAEDSLRAEEEHLLRSIENLLDATRERFETQLQERLEAVDTFFEGLELEEENGRTPRQVLDELSELVGGLPLKLGAEEQRALRQDPERVQELLRTQVTAILVEQSIARLVGAVERRLEEELDLNRSQLPGEWEDLTDLILSAIRTGFERRRQRLIGDNGDGQIARDLEGLLSKGEAPLSAVQVLQLLIQMPQGSRATFDKRTHRRVWRRTTRLTYYYATARLLDNEDPGQITQAVLTHLEGAQAAMRYAWGRSEWNRLAATRPADLDETTQRGLENLLSEARYMEARDRPLQELSGEERAAVLDELGRQALTEVYRQLLLGVISELWVEYLTNMEALSFDRAGSICPARSTGTV
jgi:preprotein translocase subunit SecA